jgi:hypothetical protein
MNVTVEFNQIVPGSDRRTRISMLRDVDLERAIAISTALQHSPSVEAVILVEGERQPARVTQMGRNLKTELGNWLFGLRQLSRRPAAQPNGSRLLPGRVAPAV